MKNTKMLFMSVLLAVLQLSCEEEESRALTYYYDETQCSDPWEMGETESEKRANLNTFLSNNNVQVISINIEQETDLEVDCEACNCGTGFRYLLIVNDEFSAKVKGLGFKPIE